MDVVFLGPPGAGKGTQAKKACDRLDLRHLSTGDLLRAAVAAGTPVGREAKAFMEGGRLVPDELVARMIETELQAHSDDSFLLDGYPRNIAQAELLEQSERRLGRAVGVVLLLDVPDSVLEERLLGRRSCPNPACGAMYHVRFQPPKVEGRCDVCGTSLVVRADDRAEVVRERLEVFHRQTAPLLDYYGVKGRLVSVDGSGTADEVEAAVVNALAER